MNALRHGLRAQKTVLPDESQEDFNQIHAGLYDLYQPQTVPEQDLVEQAVLSKWKLVRAEALESACYSEAGDAYRRSVVMNRMTQIQTRLERSYFKAYKELERIKTARAKAAPQPTQPAAPGQPADAAPKEEIIRRQVTWANPVTGIDTVLFKSENGVGVDDWSDPNYVFPRVIDPNPSNPADHFPFLSYRRASASIGGQICFCSLKGFPPKRNSSVTPPHDSRGAKTITEITK